MNNDITRMLKDWPYESGKLNVRVIKGDDGEPRIQMRLDLGLLQMCTEGRPDGQKPRGFDSLLELQESRLDESVEKGKDSEFVLSEDDCRELREEAVQYYHRYMALLVMDDFEGVVRDTSRNLRVLDLCGKHASTEADRHALEPFRAYITMMRARALASQALKDNEPKAAIHAIDEGLEALRRHFDEHESGISGGAGAPGGGGGGGSFEQSQEVQLLRSMRDSLVPKLPMSQKGELKKRLADALAAENYELAAILRDELAALKD